MAPVILGGLRAIVIRGGAGQYARAVDFSFDQRDLAHRHFQKEIQNKKNELEAQNGIWQGYVMDHYPQFLRDWLIKHVTGDDMLMKSALLAYPYDLKPG